MWFKVSIESWVSTLSTLSNPEKLAELSLSEPERYPHIKGNPLRITSYFSFGKYPNDTNPAFWRGVADYYFSSLLSAYGSWQIPMTSISATEYQQFAFTGGGNIHFFYWSDFEFFAGAGAGTSIVSHKHGTSSTAFLADVAAGMLLEGEIFHLAGEVLYQISKFDDGTTTFDMSQVMFQVGFGFKF